MGEIKAISRGIWRFQSLHSYFLVESLFISACWKARLTSGGSHGGSVYPLAIFPSLVNHQTVFTHAHAISGPLPPQENTVVRLHLPFFPTPESRYNFFLAK